MKSISMLIKPVSSSCNMDCGYCFYRDVALNREKYSYGVMSIDTLETLIRKVFAHRPNYVSLAFQGGEPTLRGLDFYKELIRLVSEYNTGKVQVTYSIQTNGYRLDEEWSKFFADNAFLVGISLDGTAQVHDRNRRRSDGSGTHSEVLRTIRLFNRHKVDYNILTVITPDVVRHIDSIYSFYKKNGFKFLQFIPCVEDFGAQPDNRLTLSSEQYGVFLKRLFDYWYEDITRGDYTFIRWFDSLMFSVIGKPSPDCGMSGHCQNQMVVEADGSVYPCDFYVLDKYRIGNIMSDELDMLLDYGKDGQFIREAEVMDTACGECKWLSLCRGGCRRYRQEVEGLGPNRFCGAYKTFFEYASDRLYLLADRLKKRNMNF